MSEITVRRMVPSDAPDVGALIDAWQAEGPLMMGSGVDPDHVRHLTYRYVHDERCCCLVAVVDKDVVGLLAGSMVPGSLNPTDIVGCQHLWYVLPSWRGTAVGPRLLQAFEDWAHLYGARYLAVGSNHGFDAERVGRFYERLGYKAYETHYVKEIKRGN